MPSWKGHQARAEIYQDLDGLEPTATMPVGLMINYRNARMTDKTSTSMPDDSNTSSWCQYQMSVSGPDPWFTGNAWTWDQGQLRAKEELEDH